MTRPSATVTSMVNMQFSGVTAAILGGISFGGGVGGMGGAFLGLLILNGSEEEQLSPIGFEPLPAAAEKTAPVTEAQAAIFAKATEGLLGVDYEPVCLIEEMDEIYYVFLCKGTVVYPGAEPAYYLAVIVDYGTEAPTAEFIQLLDDGSQG